MAETPFDQKQFDGLMILLVLVPKENWTALLKKMSEDENATTRKVGLYFLDRDRRAEARRLEI